MLIHPKKGSLHGNTKRAFTVVELIAVLAVIALLGSILVPTLARARDRSASLAAMCLNNERQLMSAALMYASDNHDNWFPNFPGQDGNWVSGFISWNPSNAVNTNVTILVDPAVSVFGYYIKQPKIYHCPADPSYIDPIGLRVRSVSANMAVGTVGVSIGSLRAGQPVNGQWLIGVNVGSGIQTQFRTYGKTTDMISPKPAGLWIFTDEHPDSINDSALAVQMEYTGIAASLIDIPGSFHDGAGTFSFGDGHVELHKWLGPTIQPPIIFGGSPHSPPAGDSASVSDVTWLQQRTSAPL